MSEGTAAEPPPEVQATGRHTGRGERGAALVEFAFALPILAMLVLGLFTGGLSYKRNAAVTQAVRDGARFGSIVDQEDFANVASWMDEIYFATKTSSGGDLDNDEEGREICVAYFDGSSWTSRTYSTTDTGTAGSASCFSDSQGSTERVQVRAERHSDLDVLFFSWTLTLAHESVASYAPVTS